MITTDRLVALVCRSPGDHPGDPRLHIRSAPDGWWYRIPLPNGGTLTVLLTDYDQIPRGRQALSAFWLSQLPESWRSECREATARPSSRLRCLPASSRWATNITGPNWVLAGDAAVAADPLCGRGIALAIESGTEAARAIVSFDRGNESSLQDYQSAVFARRGQLWREQSRLYAAVISWPNRPFWKRRNQSHLTSRA